MLNTEQKSVPFPTLVLDAISVCFSTLLTFILIDGLSFHPVVASAMVGFLGSFLSGNKYVKTTDLHNNIFIGSFAGMCSGSLVLGLNEVLAVGLISGFLCSASNAYFHGLGGRLGSIAFIASLIILGDLVLWN
ncbi:hypothetical protein [Alteromonas sp. a30]|uniref:hypothetical protein n=1 Tax=Alteromonas sp. a30 TaxID=2730917 RepID=UPI002282ADEF|nr:hypothetical protein [Alteromonas sp. a30]MCY7294239.1 hypothetical protein [Alteromonas sp. a30]